VRNLKGNNINEQTSYCVVFILVISCGNKAYTTMMEIFESRGITNPYGQGNICTWGVLVLFVSL
jgi:hypothetical protein